MYWRKCSLCCLALDMPQLGKFNLLEGCCITAEWDRQLSYYWSFSHSGFVFWHLWCEVRLPKSSPRSIFQGRWRSAGELLALCKVWLFILEMFMLLVSRGATGPTSFWIEMYKMVASPVCQEVSETQPRDIFFSCISASFFQNPWLCLCSCWGQGQGSHRLQGERGVKCQTQSQLIALKTKLFIVFHECWVRLSICDPTALTLVTNPTETQGATPMCKQYHIQCAVLTKTLQQFSFFSWSHGKGKG